jgi:hypothetical protein
LQTGASDVVDVLQDNRQKKAAFGATVAAGTKTLEHFQEKWMAVLRPTLRRIMRQTEGTRAVFVSGGSESAPGTELVDIWPAATIVLGIVLTLAWNGFLAGLLLWGVVSLI